LVVGLWFLDLVTRHETISRWTVILGDSVG
jgi:hypothetical protein